MSEQMQAAGVEWLTNLLQLQGLETQVTAHLVEDSAGESCWLTIDATALSPEQVATLQGERGSVLDSIQYLANTTLNLGKAHEDQQAFTIELDGYRARRLEELKTIAVEAAETVMANGQEYEIKALSSAERRQVHHFLKDYDNLETFSRGKEPDRRLVVCPAQQS
jgi:spoIIIJ-associated protein